MQFAKFLMYIQRTYELRIGKLSEELEYKYSDFAQSFMSFDNYGEFSIQKFVAVL
jgi:hypothetical protein